MTTWSISTTEFDWLCACTLCVFYFVFFKKWKKKYVIQIFTPKMCFIWASLIDSNRIGVSLFLTQFFYVVIECKSFELSWLRRQTRKLLPKNKFKQNYNIDCCLSNRVKEIHSNCIHLIFVRCRTFTLGILTRYLCLTPIWEYITLTASATTTTTNAHNINNWSECG